MHSQTITQTLTVLVGNQAGGTLAATGTSLTLIFAVILGVVMLGAAFWFFVVRRRSFRALFIPLILATGIASLGFGMHLASAAPTLTLDASQTNLNITVPQGGGTATAITTLTTSTANATGLTLTASLQAAEPGIGIAIKGGDVTNSTPLTAGSTPLLLKTTNVANVTDDTTSVELTFTINGTVTAGTKELKLTYIATDNDSALSTNYHAVYDPRLLPKSYDHL